jgi:cell division septum initiation protein DivIVA
VLVMARSLEIPLTDNLIDDRVQRLLAAVSSDGKTSENPMVVPGTRKPDQALQVLTMAQRTAEQHVADANRDAEKIRAAAQAEADVVAQKARDHADKVRGDAARTMSEARAAAEQASRDAERSKAEAQRQAELIVAEARTEADRITGAAQDDAEQLRLQAQRRYDDFVGGLTAKRESLQQQIEALEEFDRDYRARLMAFMQAQLRALWVDQPEVEAPTLDEAEEDAPSRA